MKSHLQYFLITVLLACATDTWTIASVNSYLPASYPTCCMTQCINSSNSIILGISNFTISASSATAQTLSAMTTCNVNFNFPTTATHFKFVGIFPNTSDTCTILQGNIKGLFDVTLTSSILSVAGTVLALNQTQVELYIEFIANSSGTEIKISYMNGADGYEFTQISTDVYSSTTSNWNMLMGCNTAEVSLIEYDFSPLSACKSMCIHCTATNNCTECQAGYYLDGSLNCIGIYI
jgi:hypothetical protein